MPNGRERRKKQRLDANLFAKIFSDNQDESLGRGVVVDVSLSGLAIESEIDIERGEEIECFVEIPYIIRATIVRREVKGQIKRYGLKITKQSILDQFILRRALKGGRRTLRV